VKVLCVVLSLFSSVLLFSGAAHAAIEYTLTDLGPVTIGGLSAEGTAVGWTQAEHAHVLAPVPQVLPELVPGAFASRAYAAAGAFIVGESGVDTFGFRSHAALWVHAQAPIDLGTLGAAALFSQATGVNLTETITGFADRPTDGSNRPVVWTGRQISELPTLGGPDGFADAINSYGDIVGQSDTVFGQLHAVLWPIAGGIVDLDTLGGDFSLARGLNNHGVVVGSAGSKAFRWTAATGMQLLPLLPGPFVGTEVDRAVRWDGGVPTDLNTLVDAPGWELQEARAINDAGQMLGAGRFQGQPRAWLLTPIPQVPVCPVALSQVQTLDSNGDGVLDLAGLDVQGHAWLCVAGEDACEMKPGQLTTLVVIDINDDQRDDLAGLAGGGVWVWLSGGQGWGLIGYLSTLLKGDWYGDGREYLAGLATGGAVYRSTGYGQWQYANGALQYMGAIALEDRDILVGWNYCWWYEITIGLWTQGQCG
jgi:probable HAF family extracellular repeat protein